MTLSQLREQLRQDVKELCRVLNRSPNHIFTEEFKRYGILKRRQEIYAWESEMTQKILQELKEGKERFIYSVTGIYKGVKTKIWVLNGAATLAELNRIAQEKLDLIGEQMDLFNEMVRKMEKRTGKSLPKWDMHTIEDMRRQLGNGGTALPPAKEPK